MTRSFVAVALVFLGAVGCWRACDRTAPQAPATEVTTFQRPQAVPDAGLRQGRDELARELEHEADALRSELRTIRSAYRRLRRTSVSAEALDELELRVARLRGRL